MSYTPFTKLSDLVKSDITPYILVIFIILLFNIKSSDVIQGDITF